MVKLTITNAAVLLSVLASTSLAQSAYEGVYARGYDSPYTRELDAVRIEARGIKNWFRHRHGKDSASPAPERREEARSWSSRSLTRRAVGSEVDDTSADPLEHAHEHAHTHVHVHTHKHEHKLSEEDEEEFFDIEMMLKTILGDLGIENDGED